MIIQQLDYKSVLINNRVYPTPVVALRFDSDPLKVTLQYFGNRRESFYWSNIEVRDKQGNVIASGATSSLNEMLIAINNIANIYGNTPDYEQYQTLEVKSTNRDFIVPATPGYLIKDVLVKTDINLKPENIKEGVELFGVIGSMPIIKPKSYISLYGYSRAIYPQQDYTVLTDYLDKDKNDSISWTGDAWTAYTNEGGDYTHNYIGLFEDNINKLNVSPDYPGRVTFICEKGKVKAFVYNDDADLDFQKEVEISGGVFRLNSYISNEKRNDISIHIAPATTPNNVEFEDEFFNSDIDYKEKNTINIPYLVIEKKADTGSLIVNDELDLLTEDDEMSVTEDINILISNFEFKFQNLKNYSLELVPKALVINGTSDQELDIISYDNPGSEYLKVLVSLDHKSFNNLLRNKFSLVQLILE